MPDIVIAPSIAEGERRARELGIQSRPGRTVFSTRAGTTSVRGMSAEDLTIHAVRPDLWPARVHHELAPLLACGAVYG